MPSVKLITILFCVARNAIGLAGIRSDDDSKWKVTDCKGYWKSSSREDECEITCIFPGNAFKPPANWRVIWINLHRSMNAYTNILVNALNDYRHRPTNWSTNSKNCLGFSISFIFTGQSFFRRLTSRTCDYQYRSLDVCGVLLYYSFLLLLFLRSSILPVIYNYHLNGIN